MAEQTIRSQFEGTENVKRSLIILEDSAKMYFCLIEVAIEVVRFELKENTTETKLRKMRCEI